MPVCSSIPWEVYDQQNNVMTDRNYVLDKWKSDFCSLFTLPPETSPEQLIFAENIKSSNTSREAQFGAVDASKEMNNDFTIEEVAKIVNKAKSGKAPGIDGLISDIFKNHNSIVLLTSLLNTCLREHLIPTTWSLGVINPIPKSANNDPRVPLNYRGISLLSVPGKLYTAAISHRLSHYLEINKLLTDEQNGFRPNRSCLDHIFALHNICNNRKNPKIRHISDIYRLSKSF